MRGAWTLQGIEGGGVDLRELFGSRNEWLNVTSHAIAWRRNILGRMSEEEKEKFLVATLVFHHGMKDIRKDYADPIKGDMDQSSKVTSRRRPGALLDLAKETTGTDDVSRKKRFEALRKFDITLMLAEIERRDPWLSVTDDIATLLSLLEEELFVGSKQIVVWSYHALKNNRHVEEIRIGRERRLDSLTLSDPHNPLSERMHEPNVTQLRNGSFFYLIDRGKGTFRTWLKMLRQITNPKRQQRFDQVMDRRGIKQIYSRSDRLYDAVAVHQQVIEEVGGSFTIRHDNVTRDGPKDAENSESDSNYRALDAEVELAGTILEMVFQTFTDYYSSELAIDDVNHDLYALRQALRHFFPVLWPQEIYGLDWKDPNMRNALRTWKSGNIGWGSDRRDPRSPHDSGSSFSSVAN